MCRGRPPVIPLRTAAQRSPLKASPHPPPRPQLKLGAGRGAGARAPAEPRPCVHAPTMPTGWACPGVAGPSSLFPHRDPSLPAAQARHPSPPPGPRPTPPTRGAPVRALAFLCRRALVSGARILPEQGPCPRPPARTPAPPARPESEVDVEAPRA